MNQRNPFRSRQRTVGHGQYSLKRRTVKIIQILLQMTGFRRDQGQQISGTQQPFHCAADDSGCMMCRQSREEGNLPGWENFFAQNPCAAAADAAFQQPQIHQLSYRPVGSGLVDAEPFRQFIFRRKFCAARILTIGEFQLQSLSQPRNRHAIFRLHDFLRFSVYFRNITCPSGMSTAF